MTATIMTEPEYTAHATVGGAELFLCIDEDGAHYLYPSDGIGSMQQSCPGEALVATIAEIEASPIKLPWTMAAWPEEASVEDWSTQEVLDHAG